MGSARTGKARRIRKEHVAFYLIRQYSQVWILRRSKSRWCKLITTTRSVDSELRTYGRVHMYTWSYGRTQQSHIIAWARKGVALIVWMRMTTCQVRWTKSFRNKLASPMRAHLSTTAQSSCPHLSNIELMQYATQSKVQTYEGGQIIYFDIASHILGVGSM
jgi:hypothetical protein